MTLDKTTKPSSQQTGRYFLHAKEVRFTLVFLLVFFALQYGYSACRDTAFERLVIDVVTVRPSVSIINLIEPREQARATGHRIVSPLEAICTQSIE